MSNAPAKIQGYGLSWALGIFINPLMVEMKSFRVIPCVGSILMSSGLVLASLFTFPIGFVVKSKDGRVGSTHLVNLRVARRKVFVFEVNFLTD